MISVSITQICYCSAKVVKTITLSEQTWHSPIKFDFQNKAK